MSTIINLAAIDILSMWMVEGQYFDKAEIKSYKPLIEKCADSLSKNIKLNQSLKLALQYALSNEQFDWEEFMLRTAFHTPGDLNETRKLFEFAWEILYPGEFWELETTPEFSVIDDPDALDRK